MIRGTIALMNLAVSPQIGDNREMTTAALSLTGIGLFPSVTVHVGLKRAWTRETLVADLTLVLLLCR